MNSKSNDLITKEIILSDYVRKKGIIKKNRFLVFYKNGDIACYRKENDVNSVKKTIFTVNIINCRIEMGKMGKNFLLKIQYKTNRSKIQEKSFFFDTKSICNNWTKKMKEIQNILINILEGKYIEDSNCQSISLEEIKSYTPIRLLGEGGNGQVILVHKIPGGYYCMKKARDDNECYAQNYKTIDQEISILQKLNHPFIIKLLYYYKDRNDIFLLEEYFESKDLYYYLYKDKRFSNIKSQFYAAQVTLALEYMHQNKIIYKDLKIENILVLDDGYIKLIDFGLSEEYIDYYSRSDQITGTPEYLPPEVIKGNECYGAVDWWALGILMCEMINGRKPFQGENFDKLFENILESSIKFDRFVSFLAKKIIKELLNQNPEFRLGGSTNGAIEVKNHPYFNDINWEKIYEKKVKPPFIPSLSGKYSISYFPENISTLEVNVV